MSATFIGTLISIGSRFAGLVGGALPPLSSPAVNVAVTGLGNRISSVIIGI